MSSNILSQFRLLLSQTEHLKEELYLYQHNFAQEVEFAENVGKDDESAVNESLVWLFHDPITTKLRWKLLKKYPDGLRDLNKMECYEQLYNGHLLWYKRLQCYYNVLLQVNQWLRQMENTFRDCWQSIMMMDHNIKITDDQACLEGFNFVYKRNDPVLHLWMDGFLAYMQLLHQLELFPSKTIIVVVFQCLHQLLCDGDLLSHEDIEILSPMMQDHGSLALFLTENVFGCKTSPSTDPAATPINAATHTASTNNSNPNNVGVAASNIVNESKLNYCVNYNAVIRQHFMSIFRELYPLILYCRSIENWRRDMLFQVDSLDEYGRTVPWHIQLNEDKYTAVSSSSGTKYSNDLYLELKVLEKYYQLIGYSFVACPALLLEDMPRNLLQYVTEYRLILPIYRDLTFNIHLTVESICATIFPASASSPSSHLLPRDQRLYTIIKNISRSVLPQIATNLYHRRLFLQQALLKLREFIQFAPGLLPVHLTVLMSVMSLMKEELLAYLEHSKPIAVRKDCQQIYQDCQIVNDEHDLHFVQCLEVYYYLLDCMLDKSKLGDSVKLYYTEFVNYDLEDMMGYTASSQILSFDSTQMEAVDEQTVHAFMEVPKVWRWIINMIESQCESSLESNSSDKGSPDGNGSLSRISDAFLDILFYLLPSSNFTCPPDLYTYVCEATIKLPLHLTFSMNFHSELHKEFGEGYAAAFVWWVPSWKRIYQRLVSINYDKDQVLVLPPEVPSRYLLYVFRPIEVWFSLNRSAEGSNGNIAAKSSPFKLLEESVLQASREILHNLLQVLRQRFQKYWDDFYTLNHHQILPKEVIKRMDRMQEQREYQRKLLQQFNHVSTVTPLTILHEAMPGIESKLPLPRQMEKFVLNLHHLYRMCMGFCYDDLASECRRYSSIPGQLCFQHDIYRPSKLFCQEILLIFNQKMRNFVIGSNDLSLTTDDKEALLNNPFELPSFSTIYHMLMSGIEVVDSCLQCMERTEVGAWLKKSMQQLIVSEFQTASSPVDVENSSVKESVETERNGSTTTSSQTIFDRIVQWFENVIEVICSDSSPIVYVAKLRCFTHHSQASVDASIASSRKIESYLISQEELKFLCLIIGIQGFRVLCKKLTDLIRNEIKQVLSLLQTERHYVRLFCEQCMFSLAAGQSIRSMPIFIRRFKRLGIIMIIQKMLKAAFQDAFQNTSLSSDGLTQDAMIIFQNLYLSFDPWSFKYAGASSLLKFNDQLSSDTLADTNLPDKNDNYLMQFLRLLEALGIHVDHEYVLTDEVFGFSMEGKGVESKIMWTEDELQLFVQLMPVLCAVVVVSDDWKNLSYHPIFNASLHNEHCIFAGFSLCMIMAFNIAERVGMETEKLLSILQREVWQNPLSKSPTSPSISLLNATSASITYPGLSRKQKFQLYIQHWLEVWTQTMYTLLLQSSSPSNIPSLSRKDMKQPTESNANAESSFPNMPHRGSLNQSMGDQQSSQFFAAQSLTDRMRYLAVFFPMIEHWLEAMRSFVDWEMIQTFLPYDMTICANYEFDRQGGSVWMG